MTGTYILPAIPPHCAEKRTRVSVVEWRGLRVLLRDEEMADRGHSFYIETDLENFIPDIPD